ncbi:MAG: hypothetical protein J5827_03245 [Oscillospiraceae bacterium]|nr:hypothetical protein [Oscillospiraceae bacterium]
MSDTLSYKCPSCSSPLEFDGTSGMLVCRSCGNSYDVDAIELLNEAETQEGKEPEFDWGAYKEELNGEVIEGVQTYKCQSCGAEVTVEGVTAATKCPYCDNVIVLEPQLSGMIRPNGIIPFKVDRKGVADKVKELCRGKKLLPKGFLNENSIKDVQGVYVPFWLFDCRADGKMSFKATRVRRWSSGNYNYTETSNYLLVREGEMAFEKIPVDGSVKMDDSLMDSIEPFDYAELKEFDTAYLSGFLADRFDADADASLPRANRRVQSSVEQAFRSTISGYNSVVMSMNKTRISDASVKYVLLPVYLITSKYRGKTYSYAINGQTGKIVGELPISRAKSWAWFGGVFAAVFALCMLIIPRLL